VNFRTPSDSAALIVTFIHLTNAAIVAMTLVSSWMYRM